MELGPRYGDSVHQVGDESFSHSESDTNSACGMSSNGTQRPSDQDLEPKKRSLRRREEDKRVFCMKLAMVLALILSALAVSLSLYFFIDSQEMGKFNESYSEAHAMVVDSMTTRLFFTLGAFDSFMVDTVSQAKAAGQIWPEVASVRPARPSPFKSSY